MIFVSHALPVNAAGEPELDRSAVWDGLVLLFLFFWMIGLLADLQRSEALSLTKFLHLPVSLSGVFLLNYLSSLMSFNLFMFVPMMVWLSVGLARPLCTGRLSTECATT